MFVTILSSPLYHEYRDSAFRQNVQSRVLAGIVGSVSEPAIRCPYFIETPPPLPLLRRTSSDVTVDLARLWTSDNVLREMSAVKVVYCAPGVMG
jgi:hypothetical protein